MRYIDYIIIVVIPLCAIGALLWWTGFLGGEREGSVKYADCREIIRLPRDTFRRYYETFTCSDGKTINGKSMGGECVRVETPLFSDKCARAYVYQKQPDIMCYANSTLTSDEKCQCDTGFAWDEAKKQC